jgi:hypothetical protein
MKDKWRLIGSPQTYQQKKFVINFCKKIHFFDKNIGNTLEFSNNIFIKNLDNFKNVELVFQSLKNDDIEKNQQIIKKISSNIYKEKFYKKSFEILYKILKCKFEKHKYLLDNLLDTNLSPLIYNNDFLDNLLGKCLTKLRNFFFLNVLII